MDAALAPHSRTRGKPAAAGLGTHWRSVPLVKSSVMKLTV